MEGTENRLKETKIEALEKTQILSFHLPSIQETSGMLIPPSSQERMGIFS